MKEKTKEELLKENKELQRKNLELTVQLEYIKKLNALVSKNNNQAKKKSPK